MKRIAVLILIVGTCNSYAQTKAYFPSNIHSHNDYEQPGPFYNAIKNGVGSIEADIFLRGGKLLVAHEAHEVVRWRSLEKLYLRPLQQIIISSGKHLFAGHSHELILMIDIKSPPRPALDSLVQLLKRYPEIIGSPVVKIAISGARPSVPEWSHFPDFIYFDGIADHTYPDSLMHRIVMMSDSFKKYSDWNGEGEISEKDKLKLRSIINSVHARKKPMRFWGTPDNYATWDLLIELGVDMINTDRVDDAARYIPRRR